MGGRIRVGAERLKFCRPIDWTNQAPPGAARTGGRTPTCSSLPPIGSFFRVRSRLAGPNGQLRVDARKKRYSPRPLPPQTSHSSLLHGVRTACRAPNDPRGSAVRARTTPCVPRDRSHPKKHERRRSRATTIFSPLPIFVKSFFSNSKLRHERKSPPCTDTTFFTTIPKKLVMGPNKR